MLSINVTIGRKHLILIAVFVATMTLIPVAAIASASLFEDVPDDSIFVNDINWMKTAGVTKGCNPPSNTKYCPKGNVSREQMAAFMHRLASNRVVDAATVQGQTAADLKGEKGDKGDPGDPGILSTYWVTTLGTPTTWAYCNTGDILLGGGFNTGSFGDVAYSKPLTHPTDGREGWTVYSNGQSTAYAICGVTP